MNTREELWNTLPTQVWQTYEMARKPFEIPRLPQAQCIVIPLVREAIAPLIVRNNDPDEITDQVLAGENRIRMIASKTKGVERRRGAQILRALKLGGYSAANKAFISKNKGYRPSKVFDLNTFVFGDSAKGDGNAIYPVHSAVLYSDAISVQPKKSQVESVFRQGGVYEDGGNLDAEDKETSSNIFNTYSVKPGTLFIQTAVFLGNRITRAGLEHWLLATGLAGSYGGATATTGTNLRTHFAGIYWGTLERDINAPSEILKRLQATGEEAVDATQVVTFLEKLFSEAYPYGIEADQTTAYIDELAAELENRAPRLVSQYETGAKDVGELFDRWFGLSK
ncbi:type I-D CRISPR-associated protein Cas7/Csc2 [Kyrpidia sp.]|uniref:type I-D CRISPR-associated protein Cas7/Csc2 n=1 Tax=Kyrpidia sp. TaxID=2073077 RepID=UPI00258C5E3A|nr:type I-D CRISPR-associated protein Cas7/Csc2 [Kyrpidia sp.]MCL6576733.1 type I-D CRISPR-associated protein Cas7/Csc2 [Kyrpidia sp.]